MTLSRPIRRLAAAAFFAVAAGPVAAQDEAPDLAAIVEAWIASPHADYASPSFTHWNADGAVPENCAACHSQPGFLDFLGADGTEARVVDHPAAINAVIGCASCHTSEAHALDTVALPSGVELAGLGGNATCTVCHAGRASGDAVVRATASIGEDTVSPDLGFINVHYGIAAAVMQGADGRAGFHYPDRSYAGQFRHVPGADTCIACHDAHTTAVAEEGCLTCHRGVEDLRDIRMRAADFDGDGDNSGGIHAEIVGLHARLYAAIQTYAAEVAGTPIGYAKGAFPYFFVDTDGDGTISEGEAIFPNRYASWTPRLLKAAYNYQVAAKDPGGYAHHPSERLHDPVGFRQALGAPDHVLDQPRHVTRPLVEVEVLHDGGNLQVVHRGHEFVEGSHQARRCGVHIGKHRYGVTQGGRIHFEHDRLHHSYTSTTANKPHKVD
jgi:hypothetical protein